MRCRREIAAIEAEIRAGNPDLQGLCLGLSDWSWELRLLIEAQKKKRGHTPTGDSEQAGGSHAL